MKLFDSYLDSHEYDCGIRLICKINGQEKSAELAVYVLIGSPEKVELFLTEKSCNEVTREEIHDYSHFKRHLTEFPSGKDVVEEVFDMLKEGVERKSSSSSSY